MKKYLTSILLLFLLCVTLLSLCMPRQARKSYDYDVGQPWKYATLIAECNFTIQKSDATYKAELDSVLKEFHPFYNLNHNVAQAEIEEFCADFNEGKFGPLPVIYREYVVKKLKQLYEQGIFSQQEIESLQQKHYHAVRIIDNKEADYLSIDQALSVVQAYEQLMAADSTHLKHELLACCELNNYLIPNLQYDAKKSSSAREELRGSVIRDKGPVMQGERIVDQGQVITPEIKEKIDSYQHFLEAQEVPSRAKWRHFIGQTLLIAQVFLIIVGYLFSNRKRYAFRFKSMLLLFLLITLFPACSYIGVRFHLFNPYLIPFAMLPLFVGIFYDSRTASMALMVSVMLSVLYSPSPLEYFLIETFMGLTCIYALKELTDRAQILRIALYVLVAGLFMQFVYDLAQSGENFHISIIRYSCIALSSVGLLFAYPLIYLLERLFGMTSTVTLLELSNINHPLLRRMSKVAQGTFNHSMQVANLAAEVAIKIGGNAQMVRTGALYHDIGKMLNPTYFTENQSGINPHDTLEAENGLSKEERSAQIIISHVVQGAHLADHYHLPTVIRDFIVTHHGLSQVRYFYVQWQNNHPNETPRTELFTYPGPNPQTLEQAILMMCDAVEATSRSLKTYTEETLQALVDKIIDGQVDAGYFRETDITFRQIADAKRVLVDFLKTVYHTRIAYPDLRKPEPPKQRHNSILGGGLIQSRHHYFNH